MFSVYIKRAPPPKLQTQILPWAEMLGNLYPGSPSALQSAMLTEIETESVCPVLQTTTGGQRSANCFPGFFDLWFF